MFSALKRLVIVGMLSSAARMPLPGATIFAIVAWSSVSLLIIHSCVGLYDPRQFTAPRASGSPAERRTGCARYTSFRGRALALLRVPLVRVFAAAQRGIPQLLFRLDRRGARLYDAGDDLGVAHGDAHDIGADGRAGPERQYDADAAVRFHRRDAGGHRRPPARHPDHPGAPFQCEPAARHRGADRRRRTDVAAVPDLPRGRRFYLLPAGAAGEH